MVHPDIIYEPYRVDFNPEVIATTSPRVHGDHDSKDDDFRTPLVTGDHTRDHTLARMSDSPNRRME